MKNLLFQRYVYQYSVRNWQETKIEIKNLLCEYDFEHNGSFSTDRKNSGNSYLEAFVRLVENELEFFSHEIGGENLFVTDVWCVRYFQGDFHPPHTHGSKGYSGVLYLDYDQDEHTGTYFVDPINDPKTDLTNFSIPNIHEGAIVIVPSNVLHFTYPNKSSKVRSIVGFDINFIKEYNK